MLEVGTAYKSITKLEWRLLAVQLTTLSSSEVARLKSSCNGMMLQKVSILDCRTRLFEKSELDIPNLLGYGPAGSQIFDVPDEVRLWWKVELLKLTKSDESSIF